MAKPRREKSGAGKPSASTRRDGGPAKRKSCVLCRDHVDGVDYKEVDRLRRFVSDRGKIRPRRVTGTCRRHQRQVALAVKRAREMALLPYVGANDAPPARSRSERRY